jgi:hypothetical protein
MWKLTAMVLFEAAIGLAVAGVVLAVGIPLMVGHKLIGPGDLTGSVIIVAVLVCSIGGMLFRPGSAINRYGKRDP